MRPKDDAMAQAKAAAPRPPRRSRRSSRRKPTSATRAPTVSFRPAVWSATRVKNYGACAAWRSTNGRSQASGRSDGSRALRSLAPGAKISFRFHARDLHLVLGSSNGRPKRFRVTVDGQVPGGDAGVDTRGGWHGCGHRAAPLPADPAERPGPRPHLHDRIPRPWRGGVFVHFRVKSAASGKA